MLIGCLESSSGSSFSLSLEVSSPGGSNLRGLLNLEWHLSDMHWSNGKRSGGANWKVGGSNSESVNWISNIVHLLDETISIDVRISSTGDSISSLHFRFGTWTTSISVRVLAEFVLGMVLASCDGWGDDGSLVGNNWSSYKSGAVNNTSRGASQNGRENDEGFHIDC
jgi:hypothetical protein